MCIETLTRDVEVPVADLPVGSKVRFGRFFSNPEVAEDEFSDVIDGYVVIPVQEDPFQAFMLALSRPQKLNDAILQAGGNPDNVLGEVTSRDYAEARDGDALPSSYWVGLSQDNPSADTEEGILTTDIVLTRII
jgi:hypothetical protein